MDKFTVRNLLIILSAITVMAYIAKLVADTSITV